MNNAVLAAGEGLAAVLAAENAALAAGDMARAAGMLAAKTRALAAFEATRDEAPHGAALLRRIAALAGENRRLLERALAVQGRVLDVIARAASPVPAYGYRAAGRPGASFRAPPVAIRASA